MRLCRGDCIGLAAPSHLATREGYAPVIQAMEARGYRVKTAENMFSSAWGFAASAEDRARDINQLIADDEVKLIFFGGGEGGDEVIPLIDYASAAAHPKMWLSFSDGTSILSAINRRAGLMVLYGQSPGGLVEPSAYDAANFRAHVEEGCGPMHLKSGAWRTVTGGTASGTLSGGYLDNYVFLAASGWIAPKPEEEFILALEEHEMFFGVEHVSDSIGRLEQTPVMPHVRGILFGHYLDPMNEHLLFRLKVLGEKWGIPVAYTDDFGHGANHAIFPFGAHATLDTENAALSYSYK